MTVALVPGAPTEGPLAVVLGKLEGVKESRGSWVARCPAHDDDMPSLSISKGRDGRALLKCHAGCDTPAIVAALGIGMGDLFVPDASGTPASNGKRAERAPGVEDRPRLVRSYDYTDAAGALLFQACRFEQADGKKTFRQRRPDGNGGWTWSLGELEPVLYRLPAVLEAAGEERTIYVVEGEKDADTLAAFNYCATTNAMGAGKWREAYSRTLARARVVILPDNDDPGRAHAEQVAASLTAAGCVVKVVELPGLPPKGDVTDWLDAGHDLDELDALEGRAPTWHPDPKNRTRWRLDELLADDRLMRPPAEIVPRLAWRAMSTLFAAREKLGKSTLMGKIAAATTRGGNFLDGRCEPGVVLIIGLEEFIGHAARRLREFNADPARVYLVDKLPTDPAARPAAIRQHIEDTHPVLVIVDTLLAYGRGAISDANNAAQMEPVVASLTTIAHQTGVAMILVHHGKKADGGYRDSSAIGGAVDVIVEMRLEAKDEATDPTRREVRVVGRVPVHSFAFRYHDGHYQLDGGSRAPLEQQILSIVRDRPGASASDVADAVEGRRQEALAKITTMIADGRLDDASGSGRGRKLYVRGPTLDFRGSP